MSRLTEKELEQISRARRVVMDETVNVEAVINQAKAMRQKVIVDLTRRALGAIAHSGAIRLLVDLFVSPLVRAYRRSRTLSDLQRLDDHMLADIGLERSMLKDYAWALDGASTPQEHPSPWARLALWLEERAAMRQLEALDDRMLADIGIARCDIEAAVKGRDRTVEPARSRVGATIREMEKRLSAAPVWTLSRSVAEQINGLESAPISETGYVTEPAAKRERAYAA